MSHSSLCNSLSDPCDKNFSNEVSSPFSDPRIKFSISNHTSLRSFQLHPLELASLGDAVAEKRQRDFRLGRAAARAAILGTGYPCTEAPPILRGESREPLWPVGLVGSIAHCDSYGVAAVAWQQDVPAVGVDIQLIEERYTDALIARFADPDEFEWIKSDPRLKTERAVRLFSAKESVFKALYPLRRVWFAFDVAHLSPTESEDVFMVSVRLPALSTQSIELQVGSVFYAGHIITGAVLSGAR